MTDNKTLIRIKILGLAVLGFWLAYGITWKFDSYARLESRQVKDEAKTVYRNGIDTGDNKAFVDRQNIEVYSESDLSHSNDWSTFRDRLFENWRNAPESQGEEIPQTEDGERFKQIMQYAKEWNLHQAPMAGIMQAIAEQFIGSIYQEGLLDRPSEETIVISLTQFDCVLFIETVLAIARGIAVQDYSYHGFVDRIVDQRYRNGHLNGYCSRLHYFSEWIDNNQLRNNVQNITSFLGSEKLNKNLNFMSQHKNSYPQLAIDQANYQCIVEMEAGLDGLMFEYIPSNQIINLYSALQAGDIIAIATDIPGLDVTHTGLVYRNFDGNMGLIHASPTGTVKISPDLQTFVGEVQNAIGILVARPNDPRQIIHGN